MEFTLSVCDCFLSQKYFIYLLGFCLLLTTIGRNTSNTKFELITEWGLNYIANNRVCFFVLKICLYFKIVCLSSYTVPLCNQFKNNTNNSNKCFTN